MDKEYRERWIITFHFIQNYYLWTFKDVFPEIARKLNARELKYMLLYGDFWKCQKLTPATETMQKGSSVKWRNKSGLEELTTLNIASYWVTWSLVCPGSSGGLNEKVFLNALPQWKGLCSPSPCLEVKVLERREIARENRQKVIPMLVFTSSAVLIIVKNTSSFAEKYICRNPSYKSSYFLPNSSPTYS